MSNENEVESMTANLREDNFKEAKPFVKPTVHVDVPQQETLTAAQVIAISKIIEQKTAEAIKNSSYDPGMEAQVLRQSVAPITDFSKLSMDAVYDLSIPIEAKEFMSADGLKIDLKDTNFEPRWVNKNPQRLGEMMGKGFTYIEPKDLINSENNISIQTSLDTQGHYVINDVVAMKIDKATYYRALRAAHLRAVATTDQANARKRAAVTANEYMGREAGRDYGAARSTGKMTFYDPDAGRDFTI